MYIFTSNSGLILSLFNIRRLPDFQNVVLVIIYGITIRLAFSIHIQSRLDWANYYILQTLFGVNLTLNYEFKYMVSNSATAMG